MAANKAGDKLSVLSVEFGLHSSFLEKTQTTQPPNKQEPSSTNHQICVNLSELFKHFILGMLKGGFFPYINCRMKYLPGQKMGSSWCLHFLKGIKVFCIQFHAGSIFLSELTIGMNMEVKMWITDIQCVLWIDAIVIFLMMILCSLGGSALIVSFKSKCWRIGRQNTVK